MTKITKRQRAYIQNSPIMLEAANHIIDDLKGPQKAFFFESVIARCKKAKENKRQWQVRGGFPLLAMFAQEKLGLLFLVPVNRQFQSPEKRKALPGKELIAWGYHGAAIGYASYCELHYKVCEAWLRNRRLVIGGQVNYLNGMRQYAVAEVPELEHTTEGIKLPGGKLLLAPPQA